MEGAAGSQALVQATASQRAQAKLPEKGCCSSRYGSNAGHGLCLLGGQGGGGFAPSIPWSLVSLASDFPLQGLFMLPCHPLLPYISLPIASPKRAVHFPDNRGISLGRWKMVELGGGGSVCFFPNNPSIQLIQLSCLVPSSTHTHILHLTRPPFLQKLLL